MKITSKHLGKHAITIQYPGQKWQMPERSRGIVVLLSDKESGELNCTSCMLCQRACPTGAIRIDSPRDEVTKKRTLKGFTVDHGLCCFCGLCEEACNFCAIKMAGKYEFSTIHKEDLVWDMKKLQEMGLDVSYVDTRKKKAPVAEVKPAAAAPVKPATEAPADAPTTEATDKPTEGTNA
jgi:NADH-quinone oxidoreductase subunit I